MKEAERLLIIQRQLIITVLALLLLALVCVTGYFFGDILRILGIALVLSYMVINIVDWLEKRLRNRALSVILVYVAMLAVISVSALLIVPAVVYQVTQLVQTTINAVPEALGRLSQMLVPLEQKFHQYHFDIKADDIINNVIANLPKPDANVLMSRGIDVAMGTMTWLLYWVSISVVSFYFLLDGYKITEALINLFPAQQKPLLHAVAADADKSLQSFFRGQLVLGLAFGLLMLVVYSVLGVQYALLLSVFLGVMEILPVIGPPIGFAPAILSVMFHGMSIPGNTLAQVIILTLIFSVLQQLKDNLVAPRYIGNVIGLHPIMIFIAIMIGARLDGALGIIFALPAASVANVFFTHLHASWTEKATDAEHSDDSTSESCQASSSQSEAEKAREATI
jgi:predicted PurR-regulated permease PerM